jgi:hypothetical protein
MAGCTAVAARAIRQAVTLTVLPSACRGLEPADLERAAVAAIDEVAGHGDKATRRRLESQAEARLSYLIDVARRGEIAQLRRAARPGPASRSRHVPVDLAALIAWLLTVASGGYLLTGWLAHGGLRRARTGRGLPAPVILAHFGLALTGLATWIGYLISGSAPVAWIAAGLLLPVLGLGIATLMTAIPDAGPAEAGPAQAGPAQAGPEAGRPPMPVLAVAAHGIFATLTLLLVLLAVLAAR